MHKAPADAQADGCTQWAIRCGETYRHALAASYAVSRDGERLGLPKDLSGPSEHGPGPAFRHVAAVVAGNALEFYDFLAFSFFALQIGRAFFPSHDPAVSLLATLAVFGAGFIPRPFGAWFFGWIGDRRGRKPAMLLSFSLMGLALAGTTLTPGYHRIGLAAPILICLFRLIQGFALGGEVGPSTAFLLEASPAARRGLVVSAQLWSQSATNIIGGVVGLAIGAALGPAVMDSWGWRLGFAVGLVILPLGLILRRSLPETLEAPRGEEPEAQTGGPSFWRVAWLGGAMLTSATIVTYVLIYLTTYAQDSLGLSKTIAFEATTAIGVAALIACPVADWLSDRIGRKPVMIAAAAPLMLAAIPVFWLMVHHRGATTLIVGSAALRILGAVAATPALVTVAEAIGRRSRAIGLGLIYALAITLFGGSTQFVVAWLIKTTHDPVVPGWYVAAATAVGLAAMLAFPETAPIKRTGKAAAD